MSEKNIEVEQQYWNNFYRDFSSSIPSQFCVLTANEVDVNTPIVEFGCGNGRDSQYFALRGNDVTAVDYSNQAVDLNNARTKQIPNISFLQGNVGVSGHVSETVNIAKSKNSKIAVYTRFFLHSIDDDQHKIFIDTLSDALSEGDMLYFEFRSKEDKLLEKTYEGHFRRFVDTPDFIREITGLGFDVQYSMIGQGMAKYHDEDPYVARVIAIKR